MTNDDVDVIRYLVNIRIKAYQISSENILLKPPALDHIINLSLGLINKIKRANLQHHSEDNLKIFESIKQNIHTFALKNPQPFVFFSAQLLQFYTIICDEPLASKNKFLDAFVYLQSKNNIFGNFSNNLLLIEYFLIMIYHDISIDIDELDKKPSLRKTSIKKWADYDRKKISTYLNDLSFTIDNYMSHSSLNIFVNYLNVILNYTQALELEYKLNLNIESYLSLESPTDLVMKQDTHIQKIHNSLAFLEAHESFDPFFLGEKLFSKLSLKSVDEFKKHLQKVK